MTKYLILSITAFTLINSPARAENSIADILHQQMQPSRDHTRIIHEERIDRSPSSFSNPSPVREEREEREVDRAPLFPPQEDSYSYMERKSAEIKNIQDERERQDREAEEQAKSDREAIRKLKALFE